MARVVRPILLVISLGVAPTVAQLRLRPLGQHCHCRPQRDLSEGLSICPLGGRWTVTVRKLSPAPAVVSVAFHFE